MSGNSLATPGACLKRAIDFKADAEQLLSIGSDWYAVAYFYAAYHIVRASLLQDPIFKDLVRLQSYSVNWIPGDQFNTGHQARRGGSTPSAPGVRDMVQAFYIDIQIEYARLHSASIALRYGVGIAAYDSAVLVNDFDVIALASKEGRLVAP